MERHKRRKWRSTAKLIDAMPRDVQDKIIGLRIGPELVEKAKCTEDGHTKLVRDLLSYVTSTEARKYVKDYSTRCVSEARSAIDNASVYLYNNRIEEHDNPFRRDSSFYGTWWLHEHGLMTSVPQGFLRFGVGLLYVRFEPWGSISLLNIFWNFRRPTSISAFMAASGYDYNNREPLAYFVQYTFDDKNLDMSDVTMKLNRRDLAYKDKTEFNHPSCLQFPPVEGETFPDMNTMLEQVFHTRSPKLHPIIGDYHNWQASPFLLWTIMSIIDGKAPPDLGVSVDKLSPNEWVIGKNMKQFYM